MVVSSVVVVRVGGASTTVVSQEEKVRSAVTAIRVAAMVFIMGCIGVKRLLFLLSDRGLFLDDYRGIHSLANNHLGGIHPVAFPRVIHSDGESGLHGLD